jgi:anthranilate synthase component I
VTIHTKTLIVDGITPVLAYASVRGKAGEGSFLLESVVPGERWGRYSILGYRPRSHVVVYGESGRDPFARLSELIPTNGPAEATVAERFARSHVGILTYDMVHYATKVDAWPKTPEPEPIARLVGNACVIVFDNLLHTATIAAHSAEEVAEAERDLAAAKMLPLMQPPDPGSIPDDIELDTPDAAFEKGVDRVKEYIRAGDAFQIVLARTFSTPADSADPFDVYRALRVLSPSPYMFLLEFPARQGAPRVAIAGASPETHARVEDGRLTLRPIAGTRRRGRSAEEDEAMAREMLADPKERAEHVMLIDLARNDIGRVATPGSVRLVHEMEVERYSHVMHIVSEVQGDLVSNMGPFDALKATFPAGTLSGAPKVRAMQIIRELETRPRGVYGGAIGYVTSARDFDFAIAIRTVVMKGDRFEVTAGAGIVADSVPRLEAKETWNKAKAALSAIHAARRR